jgi:hypothetical protein
MLKGFISYAHDDHAAFAEMRKHLRAIERAFEVEFWADKRVKPASHWSPAIARAIEAAQIHILMVSPAYISADYIFDHELPAIRDKLSRGDVVIPVIIERCAWQLAIGTLQAVPTDSSHRLRPVNEWRPRRRGFDAVREQITTALTTASILQGKNRAAPPTEPSSEAGPTLSIESGKLDVVPGLETSNAVDRTTQAALHRRINRQLELFAR